MNRPMFSTLMNLKDHIRGVPDFPIEGILFYDIATLLREPMAMAYCLDQFEAAMAAWQPDVLAGIESCCTPRTADGASDDDDTKSRQIARSNEFVDV